MRDFIEDGRIIAKSGNMEYRMSDIAKYCEENNITVDNEYSLIGVIISMFALLQNQSHES